MIAMFGTGSLILARSSVVDLIRGLVEGERSSWIALVIIAGCIAFFIAYEKVTGKSIVRSRKERREARRRRKHVVWEHRRDD
jgi:hypothetical protein